MTGDGLWLTRLTGASAEPAIRVFAFPNAGAGPNVFTGLARHLPAWLGLWAVALPGREARFNEPPRTELAPLTADLAEALLPHSTRPYVLFGDCSGALLAYLVSHRVRELGGPAPARLVVSGYPPPDQANRTPEELLALDSAEFWSRLVALGGIPPEIAAADDLREVFEPAFRADYHLLAQYEHRPLPPLDTPIISLSGPGSPNRHRYAAGWAAHGNGGPHHEEVGDGGRTTDSPAALGAHLAQMLGDLAPPKD
ncbi:Surfactin synthase thioesterase subunit [Actinomadura meyerae]|uniref:Surfactin synthase thioesterase subunit n=1 Tax=Actinomadura meyerae TaxID=240840 RepID=A0A239NUU1_9ACTN|nr:thioesterase domain-containing protein [Actinomadura meyerae]SNT58636.1 Surfactin synthase thioesterase subunit [Actinomadura meyerae]